MKNLVAFILLSTAIFYRVDSTTTSIPSTGNPPHISAYSGLTSIYYKLYSFGGADASGAYTNEIRQFDLSDSQWSALPCGSQTLPSPRMSAVVISYQGSLFIFGGQTITGVSEEFWQYNIALGAWKQIPLAHSVPIARTRTAFVLHSNYLILFGGISYYGPDNSLLL